MKEHTVALVVARPGRLRDSLEALLAALPQIEIVNNVDDGLLALQACAEFPPDLVLLDVNLPGNEAYATLRQVKGKWPQARRILLVDGVEQQQVAKARGADDALLRGFSIAELVASVEKLLGGQWRRMTEREMQHMKE